MGYVGRTDVEMDAAFTFLSNEDESLNGLKVLEFQALTDGSLRSSSRCPGVRVECNLMALTLFVT